MIAPRRPTLRTIRWMVIAASLWGCEPEPPREGERPTPKANSQGESAERETDPPAPLASPTELRGFVDRWLRAQNDGDFEAYRALYASRFSGIKRAENREYALDRAGWMRDRARMFAKPMVVKASITEVRALPAVATLDFVQQWSNDNYRDEGPKRLLLVREDGELRISREEMLRSAVRPRDPALTDLWFVQPGGGIWLVLDEPTGPTGPIPGELSLNDGDGVYVVRTASPETGGLKLGTPVRVTYDSGQQCSGVLDRFARSVAVVPHFGTVQCWDDPTCGPRPSELERARALWEEAAPASPVARVALQEGATCAGRAVFARPASRDALRTATETTVQDPEAMAARLRALPAFRRQRPTCVRDEAGCDLEWKAFRFPHSNQVWTSGVLQPAGCGGDEAALWALWRGKPGGPVELVRVARSPTPGAVIQMLDVDADGEPEFLVRDWLGVQWRIEDPKSGETLASWGPEYHDCPC